MSINVGSVSVRVVPDARDFDNRLRADLGNLPDQRVRVTPDMAGFRERVRQTVQPTGQESGGLLAQGMRQGFMRQSPLITAAIAGALTAGAPAIIGAGTILFGALGALSVKSSQTVKKAWTDLGVQIKEAAQADAGSLVPVYANVATQIGAEFHRLDPEIAQAFQASGPLVESFTSAIMQAADTAVPGLVNAVKQAGPVIHGLDALVVDIGKGFAGLLNAVTQHAPAAGAALSGLGDILQTALPMLGTLLGQGAELAQAVLPPLAGALGLVGKALNVIAPVLPTVVLGFLGFKVATLAAGYLGTFAQQLAMASYSSSSFAGAAGRASTAVSGLAKALPAVTVGIAALAIGWSNANASIDKDTQALVNGGQQAVTALQELKNGQRSVLDAHGWTDFWHIVGAGFSDGAAQIEGYNSSLDKAKQKAKEYRDSLTPLARAQQDVATSQNDYLYAVQKWGAGSGQAAGAAVTLRDKEQALKNMQGLLTTATKATTTAAQQNATRLQGIADKASAASTQINLLKGALDALTGKQVSETEAQIAVTQATNAAITSVKGLHGGLLDANGALTVQTEKGAAAQQALIQLAGSDNTLIATMEQHGATTDKVRAKDAELRQSFIDTAEKMGYTAGQAQALADKIYGIPAKRNVEITADTSPAAGSLNALIGKFQSVNFGSALHARMAADGGYITGPGTGTSDSIPARLSNGEFVVKAEQTAKYLPLLHAMNEGVAGFADGGLVGFANGGLVGSSLMRYLVELTQAGSSQFSGALERALASIAPAVGSAVGGGASRWAGVVEQVMGMLGLPQAALAGILHIIQAESGGNPNAINLTDSNARAGHPSQGLMQTIPSTFYRWAGALAGRGITDPLANVYAGTNYALHTYGLGMLEDGGRSSGGRYIGYDQGGTLDPGYHLVYNGTGAQELIAPKRTFEQVMSGATGGSRSTVNHWQIDASGQDPKQLASTLMEAQRRREFLNGG